LHKKRYNDTRFIDITNLSFEEFVVALRDKHSLIPHKRHSEVSHFLPQHHYTHNKSGQLLVDFVGRFEQINEAVDKLGKKLGITKRFTKVDQYSADQRLHFAKYYTTRTAEIVARLYERDFQLFGYPTNLKPEPIRIVHVVNPFHSSNDADADQQALTMKSIVAAKNAVKGRDKVEMAACMLKEDYAKLKGRIPADFKKLFIDKTINQYVDLGLEKTRELPLIRDILDCLYDHTKGDTDLFIYSNMDIMVTNNFYQRIFEIVRSGIGHFCLNRSTVEENHNGMDPERDGERLKQLAKKGSAHPGYDCFVFFREKYPRFDLRELILGYTPIGECLKNRLSEHWSFKTFEKENLTYHFGCDAPHYQKTVTNLVYTLHNFKQSGLESEFRSHFQRIFGLNVERTHMEAAHANVCKLNLTFLNRQNHQHCQGWKHVAGYLKSRMIHNDRGVYLIDFFDKDIDQPEIVDVCHSNPWVGFVHMAPGVDLPENTTTLSSLFRRLERKRLMEPLFSNCKGLFVLTRYLKRYLEEKLADFCIPVEVYCHPKELTMQHSPKRSPPLQNGDARDEVETGTPGAPGFGLKEYLQQKKRRIIHVGKYLRNTDSFHSLEVPKNFTKQMLNNALSDGEYVSLLTNSIVFVDLYDASASNMITECIVANVPLLINPLPAVMEYLGENYPFYYRTLREAADKLANDHYIVLTYHYMNKLNKEAYSYKAFFQQWINSQILKNIRNVPFPTQNQLNLLPLVKIPPNPYKRPVHYVPSIPLLPLIKKSHVQPKMLLVPLQKIMSGGLAHAVQHVPPKMPSVTLITASKIVASYLPRISKTPMIKNFASNRTLHAAPIVNKGHSQNQVNNKKNGGENDPKNAFHPFINISFPNISLVRSNRNRVLKRPKLLRGAPS